MDDFAPTFKMSDGKIVLTSAEYNRFIEEHGSSWNWCQAFGYRLIDATHNADGTVTVFVEELQRDAGVLVPDQFLEPDPPLDE